MPWLTNPYRFGQAARYWRWRPLAAQSWIGFGESYVAELHLALTPGGSNIALGKPAAASITTAVNRGPEKAFDGSGDTFWSTPSLDRYTHWISVDLTTAQMPAEVGVQAHSTLPMATPNVWLLQSSNDNANWSSIMLFEQAIPTVGGQQQFNAIAQQNMANVESNARAWRVDVASVVSGSEADTREIEFFPTYGGTPLGSQADFAFVRRTNASVGNDGIAGRAFDKNATTLLRTESTTMPTYIGFARQNPVGVMEEMRYTPGSVTNRWPTALSVAWSVDGINWNTKKSFSGITGWTAGVPMSFDLR